MKNIIKKFLLFVVCIAFCGVAVAAESNLVTGIREAEPQACRRRRDARTMDICFKIFIFILFLRVLPSNSIPRNHLGRPGFRSGTPDAG